MMRQMKIFSKPDGSFTRLGFCLISIILLGLVPACHDDEQALSVDEFQYHVRIYAPDTTARHLGDTLHIDVEFESQTGMTVHHVNVRIYNVSTLVEVYNQPADAHVHEISGVYEFTDHLVLSEANSFSAHSDWVLEASVWGHDEGVSEVRETIEFHVHPA